MKYLVLGGTRFVGFHLVQLLHSQGHTITVLNRGQTQTLLPEGVNRIRADRSDPDQVSAALNGRHFDAAFDISGYKPSELKPVIDALDGNVESYVFCSSAAVYPATDIAPILEDHPLNRSPEAGEYTRDKVLCEDMLLEAFRTQGFPATIIRPPYVYGPHDHVRQHQFSIFARLTRGRAVIVPGDGLALTHSVHVDDLAAAFASVPGRIQALGQAYNATGPEAITANGYISIIASIMKVDTEIVHINVRDYEAMLGELTQIQTAEIFYYDWRESLVYSNEKLRRELGWSPRYDIRSGIEMTYQWWLHQDLDKEPWDFSSDDQALAWLRLISSDDSKNIPDSI
jgi:nucleoside-diphosphate-sugar epimerase